MRILITGSAGLVGSSLVRIFEQSNDEIFAATRNEADLFSLSETKALLAEANPDIIINAAAKVGGIYANNTERTDFIFHNLKFQN